jgi:hypothetical protein
VLPFSVVAVAAVVSRDVSCRCKRSRCPTRSCASGSRLCRSVILFQCVCGHGAAGGGGGGCGRFLSAAVDPLLSLVRRMASCSFAPFYEGKSSRGPTATGTPWKTCRAAAAALPLHVPAIEFIHIHMRSSEWRNKTSPPHGNKTSPPHTHGEPRHAAALRGPAESQARVDLALQHCCGGVAQRSDQRQLRKSARRREVACPAAEH